MRKLKISAKFLCLLGIITMSAPVFAEPESMESIMTEVMETDCAAEAAALYYRILSDGYISPEAAAVIATSHYYWCLEHAGPENPPG